MHDKLAMTAEEIRTIGRDVVEWLARYYEGLPARPLLVPTTSAEMRTRVAGPLPASGTDFGELLGDFEQVIAGFSRHNGHPRFFGYISSPGSPISAMAQMLTAALNVNVTSWRSGPAACEIEHVVVGWLKEMLGYPGTAAGLLTSGGSMANFAALAAAREAKAPGKVVYVSSEGHSSIRKAAKMLGIGEENVREVGVDAELRIDVERLAAAVREDRAAGRVPMCVVANAGSTATGAFDPIAALAEFARQERLWLHVDAAYGGFAALAPSVRGRFAGIEAADSVALDPHKWLYTSVGCGCVLYRDPASARAAFGHEADYTRTIGLERDEAFVFWDYGPELSRPFRALELWLHIKHAGASRLGEAIEHNMACARYFAQLVRDSGDFEMAAPVGLSVFCFRKKGATDAEQERILVNLQRGGSSYLSNARIHGRFAFRGCVVNYRTTERDMEILLDDMRRAAAV
jgi:glutamate/tyrosine decarboxylase-like PLP-dependent enzyme